jgi:hypothetical protein
VLLGHRVIEAEEARRLDVGSGPLRESLLLRRRLEDAQAAVDFVFRRALGAGREVDALSYARPLLRVKMTIASSGRCARLREWRCRCRKLGSA